MATNEELEIYKQRYETFRYLDGLHWQMFKIVMVLGPFVLAYIRASAGTNSSISQWILLIIGVLFALFGAVMLRIGQGIDMNNQVLHKFASKVGDTDIPQKAKKWKSARSWAAFVLIVSGIACVVMSFISMNNSEG